VGALFDDLNGGFAGHVLDGELYHAHSLPFAINLGARRFEVVERVLLREAFESVSLLAVVRDHPRPAEDDGTPEVRGERALHDVVCSYDAERGLLLALESIDLVAGLRRVKEELAVFAGEAQGDRIGLVVITVHSQDPRGAGLQHAWRSFPSPRGLASCASSL